MPVVSNKWKGFIYTLDASDVRQAAAKLALKSVTVEHQQLVVTLGFGP